MGSIKLKGVDVEWQVSPEGAGQVWLEFNAGKMQIRGLLPADQVARLAASLTWAAKAASDPQMTAGAKQIATTLLAAAAIAKAPKKMRRCRGRR